MRAKLVGSSFLGDTLPVFGPMAPDTVPPMIGGATVTACVRINSVEMGAWQRISHQLVNRKPFVTNMAHSPAFEPALWPATANRQCKQRSVSVQ